MRYSEILNPPTLPGALRSSANEVTLCPFATDMRTTTYSLSASGKTELIVRSASNTSPLMAQLPPMTLSSL